MWVRKNISAKINYKLFSKKILTFQTIYTLIFLNFTNKEIRRTKKLEHIAFLSL